MPLAALAIKFGGKLPSGMLLTGCCADNAVGGPFHQFFSVGSLMGCCGLEVTQAKPLVAPTV